MTLRRSLSASAALTIAVLLIGQAPIWQVRQSHAQVDATPATAEEIARLREKLDNTLWSTEVAAQRHEGPFISLWDKLRESKDQFQVLANFPFESLVVGEAQSPRKHDLGIEVTTFGDAVKRYTPADVQRFVADLSRQGYRLVESEWHHATFEQADKDAVARSTVSMTLHVERKQPPDRIAIKGKLHVEWSGKADAQGNPIPKTITTADIELWRRQAPLAFEEILTAASDEKHPRIMPLLVYDLNGDGLSEIVLGGLNRVYWNEGNARFRDAPLLENAIDMFDAAILADFTGDGHVDLVCVGPDRYPRIFEGTAGGKFPGYSRRCAKSYVELPKSFTAGDVDGDGDLDLWIGQYKFPYVEGSMPTPFYDANDGYPATLLINDGKGNFLDNSDAAGLSKKRNRRTFSSSLVDLDDDGDLDLITVNDFCGIDVYANDGTGHFTDKTDAMLDQRHLFGMGHCFADFNGDGRLDFYAIGMSSTTARRLDRMKLGPADRTDINAKRSEMGYGNRLMLAAEENGQRVYRQAKFNDRVARTGWSWGATAADFDNDGDKDIFVTNGHSSGRSARDYCTRYWCHDVYTGSSQANQELFKLFGNSLGELHSGEISWNGFEHDVLWINDGGRDFHNVAFPLGVAFEFDGRAAASDDLDADGRPDLLVVEYHAKNRREVRYKLHVLRNTLETDRHWIGVRLTDAPGRSPIGARVTVSYAGGKQIGRVVTGDSFSSQHAPTLHFGLGDTDRVDAIEVQWLDGNVGRIDRPGTGRYHRVEP